MYILEQAAAALVFSCRLERRKESGIRSVLSLALVLFLALGMTGIEKALRQVPAGSGSAWTAGLSTVGFSLAITFLLAGTMVFIFRVSFTEALYAEICAYLAEHMAYCIRILAGLAAGSDAAAGPGHFLYWAIHILVYLAVYRLFAKRMIHKGHYFAAPVRTTVLLFYALSIILVASSLASLFHVEALHAVYALAFSGFALFSQLDRQKQLAELEKSAVRQQLMIAQREQYELYRQNVSTVDRKCHDLRHQAGHLLKSAVDEAQKEEIRSLMKDIMIYDSFVRTGCRDLDAILTQKNEVCRRKDIELTCIADGKLLSFMDGADLFAVFDRAFDRAISDAAGLPKELRRIHFHVAEKFGLIAAALEYPCPAEKKEGKGGSRDDQLIGALELALEKYDGTVRISQEGSTECIRIAMQAPDEV